VHACRKEKKRKERKDRDNDKIHNIQKSDSCVKEVAWIGAGHVNTHTYKLSL
jgi:hypothetical protein